MDRLIQKHQQLPSDICEFW